MYPNDTHAALLELERQRTGGVYESTGDYRCENGCAGAQALFFVEGQILCEKCLADYLRKAMAAVIENARAAETYPEVPDVLADIIDDMAETELLNYAEYYYSRAV